MPHDDIAPLVRPAHLKRHAVAFMQRDEVIGLETHVVEFEERQLVLTLEAQLDGIHRQHAVDREMAADLAQEIDVVEAGEPLGIIGHDRIGLALAEVQEFRKGSPDPRLVGLDRLLREELAALILAGRIADPRRTAADQRHGLAAGLLQPAQHHDRKDRTSVKRGGGAIKADIGGEIAALGLGVEPGEVRTLMEEAARREHGEEIGLRMKSVGQGDLWLGLRRARP